MPTLAKSSAHPWRRLLASLLAVGASAAANAGYVTENEAGMDAIYSQAVFNLRPVDIRFDAVQTITNAALASIDSDAEFWALNSLANPSSKVVSMFFVDQINFCGYAAPNIIGCGSMPGNLVALDSDWAADPTYGANLLAHELGHNLGLNHVSGYGSNLMNPAISTNGSLTSFQAMQVLSSSLIQTDAVTGQYFVEIAPFAIVAVPEPETYAMLMAGLGLMGWIRRRRAGAV